MVVNIEVGGKIHSITAGMAARSFAISLIGTSGMAFVVMATNPNFSNEANTIGLAIIVGILASAIGATGLISTYAIGMRYRMMNVLILNGQVTLRIAAVFLLVAIGISSPTMFFVGISVSGAMLLAVLIAIVAKKSSEATSKAKIVPHLRTSGFFQQYRHNWPVTVGSSLFIHGDKVILAFFLPLEMIGLLAIYQQIARLLSNTTIGAVFQFLTPFLMRHISDETETQNRPMIISILAVALFMVGAVFVGLALPIFSKHFIHAVFELEMAGFLLVSLTIGLDRASRINELSFFRRNKVNKLILPLVVSVAAFAVLVTPFSTAFGLTGAIVSLLIAAAIRYVLVLVVESRM